MNPTPAPPPNPFFALRRFVRQPERERCELCGQDIAAIHPHLLEVERRRVVCSCHGCAILFADQDSGRFRRIPERVELLADFYLSDAQWDQLLIPINLVFFFIASRTNGVVALYPSPAGATAAQLPLDTWPEMVARNPRLQALAPDVEALLVNRVGATGDHYLAPIDACYQLVGLIRAHWRGLSGGVEVWAAVTRFFADLQAKAAYAQGDVHA